jgi:adenylate cyclase
MNAKIIPLLLIALISGFLAFLSFSAGFFAGLENFFEDLLFSAKPIDRDIVILAIDSNSLSRIGQWPWPRNIFAKALSEIDKNPPQVLGLDVIFAEESRFGKTDDASLIDALEKISYPVVMPIEAEPGRVLKPLPSFIKQKSVGLGWVNLFLDRDGVARKFPLTILDGEEIRYKTFAYEAVKRSSREIPNENTLGDLSRIVYAGPPGSIRRIPFWRLLEEEIGNELKGRIVFIGVTAPDLHDEQLTPFSRGTPMPGVEIQANIANMLISGYRLASLNKFPAGLWIFFAALLPSLFFMLSRRSLKPLLINIGFGIGYLLVIILLFERGVVANIIHINFSWILSTASLFTYRYYTGEKERRELKNAFSKYVSKEVLEHILREPDKLVLGGEEREITILFSDIRGFTNISEKTAPSELVGILNRYFTAMSEVIFKHNGVLDKYIGDAIMAFWGAPIKDENQADNSVKAGLEMLEVLKRLNEEFRAENKLEINIGVGIYTGPAVVGNIGSKMRFDYTAIGDSVNVASRLEGLNKTYATKIIIGESVRNKLKENYAFELLGSVEVKGREQSLNIYGL